MRCSLRCTSLHLTASDLAGEESVKQTGGLVLGPGQQVLYWSSVTRMLARPM